MISPLKVLTGEMNDLLRGTAQPVQTIDKTIVNLGKKMVETMKKKGGVGLAAPQVGVMKRIIVTTLQSMSYVMINPEILSFSAECSTREEGCLSLPQKFGDVTRSEKITVRYMNIEGEKKEDVLSGLEARIVQHEIDHLNGILFTDRIKKEEKQFFREQPLY
jgi:peptide deformylase